MVIIAVANEEGKPDEYFLAKGKDLETCKTNLQMFWDDMWDTYLFEYREDDVEEAVYHGIAIGEISDPFNEEEGETCLVTIIDERTVLDIETVKEEMAYEMMDDIERENLSLVLGEPEEEN